MCSLTCERKAFDMLADEGEANPHSGALTTGLHLPKEWISSLITFIAGALPAWRDGFR